MFYPANGCRWRGSWLIYPHQRPREDAAEDHSEEEREEYHCTVALAPVSIPSSFLAIPDSFTVLDFEFDSASCLIASACCVNAWAMVSKAFVNPPSSILVTWGA